MAETGTFITWRDLLNQLKNDLASCAFRTMTSYTVSAGGAGGSRSVSYRGLAELKALMDWVQEEVDKEEGTAYAGRTYALNGGRG